MFADFVENDAGIFPIVRASEDDDAEILWEGGAPAATVDGALDAARRWIEYQTERDWRYEVANGDTYLGYAEWLQHRREGDRSLPPQED